MHDKFCKKIAEMISVKTQKILEEECAPTEKLDFLVCKLILWHEISFLRFFSAAPQK